MIFAASSSEVTPSRVSNWRVMVGWLMINPLSENWPDTSCELSHTKRATLSVTKVSSNVFVPSAAGDGPETLVTCKRETSRNNAPSCNA